MAKNQPQGRSAKSYARVLIRQGFQEPAAYRLASIGLVGNVRNTQRLRLIICLPIGFDRIGWKLRYDILTVGSIPKLTDWLRSDWLETLFHFST